MMNMNNFRDSKGRFMEGHGYGGWNKGIPHTEETKKKISEILKGKNLCNTHGFKKGQSPWNKGLTKNNNKIIKRMAIKISQKLKGRKLSKELIKKILRRRIMSSLEIKFNDIVKKNNLPYKFVGNGKFFIERKNPDFINCNGEKIAIEVFYRGHKEYFSGGLASWKRERKEIFSKYGWKIEFFDETQVKEEIIIKRLEKGD